MIAAVAVVALALALALAAILGAVALAVRRHRADRAAAAAIRRAARIDADRQIVNGTSPLPPGVSLSDAYLYAAARGISLADAAFEIHRAEALAIIGKAVRRPRPGD